MRHLHHILAATDLSAPARHAVQRAAYVSKDTDAALHVLHVVNLPPLDRLRQLMGGTPAGMEQRVIEAARQKLHSLLGEIRQRPGVSADARAVAGGLLAELGKMTDGLPADLLVCGAKGESFIRHHALGTTALRLLSTARCPVLVVKQPPHEPYNRLLIAVDFSPTSMRSIQHARRLAPKAELVLLHVFDVPFEGHLRHACVEEDAINHYRIMARQEATRKMQALRSQAGLTTADSSMLILQGDPALRITEQEQERGCDLIVMGKQGENRIEDLLLGSVTQHVLAESQGDVLISV